MIDSPRGLVSRMSKRNGFMIDLVLYPRLDLSECEITIILLCMIFTVIGFIHAFDMMESFYISIEYMILVWG